MTSSASLLSYQPFKSSMQENNSPRNFPKLWIKRAVTPYRQRCSSIGSLEQIEVCDASPEHANQPAPESTIEISRPWPTNAVVSA
ncbi:unnamed protein product [Aphanomyces euteiches]